MIVPPISLSTTFERSKNLHGFDYSRGGNPTRRCLERCIAALENAKHGLAFSSGLGALTSLIQTMKSGAHVILSDDINAGTNRYFNGFAENFGIEFSKVDFSDICNLEQAMKHNTKLVWIESPTNPTLKVIDIRAVAEVTKKHEDCLFVVDNTFMTPYFQRPLSLGADVVMHSASKYINGHSDVVMGLLMTNDDELHKKLRFSQNTVGAVPSPFDCYLVNRGIKTLSLRMEKHQKNAMAVARFLESSKYVERVSYPGLPSHPQHDILKKQATGCSGMVSFWVEGNLEMTKKFLKNLNVFSFASSLGGFESLAEHPVFTSLSSIDIEVRQKLCITDNLVRLSVGIEDAEVLVQDLEQALENAADPDQKD